MIKLEDLFTSDEKANFYNEGRKLEEDLLFLNLMTSRLKTGEFDFKVIPLKKSSIHQKFLMDLYLKSYDFKGYEYIMVYEAAIKCFEEIDKENYSEQYIVDICKCIHYRYNLLLSDYTNSFIGCSRGCNRAHSIFNKLKDKITEY